MGAEKDEEYACKCQNNWPHAFTRMNHSIDAIHYKRELQPYSWNLRRLGGGPQGVLSGGRDRVRAVGREIAKVSNVKVRFRLSQVNREINMKAIRIYGPCDARYEEVPIKKPKSGEVVISIKAVGLCGTDYELYTNEMIYIQEGLCKLPITPGHEWSGEIVETGENAGKFKVGDRVTGECTVSCGECSLCKKGLYNMCINRTETGVMSRDGGFAEYITFPVSHLHKFGSCISYEEASLIEPTGIAMYVVKRSHVSPMDNVLVIGPGPIGLQAAQIVKKIFGSKRIILSGTRKERLDRARIYDLDGYINVREEDLFERVRDITEGEMIDTVIETSGGLTVFDDIKKIINPCGKVGLVGFFGAKKPSCDWDSLTTRDISIYGSLGSPHVWGDIIKLIENGKLDTRNLISHEMELKSYGDFKNAIDIMTNRTENVSKIILKPMGETP